MTINVAELKKDLTKLKDLNNDANRETEKLIAVGFDPEASIIDTVYRLTDAYTYLLAAKHGVDAEAVFSWCYEAEYGTAKYHTLLLNNEQVTTIDQFIELLELLHDYS